MTERGYQPGKQSKALVHAIEKTPLASKKDLAYARKPAGPPRAPEETTLYEPIHNLKPKKIEEFAKKEISEKQDKIIFDEAAKEIRIGEIILSEGLTSSEFKLLKFFILNPEKIVERDEIISSVWGDLSSTAGVTEQALDQLIFRLRKKIEKDISSPTHIQTVKGRGFKFTP
jgi:DNA-binding response OmpR family regulator